MKSRIDFDEEKHYIEYVRIYLAGQAISALSCMEFTHDINYDKLSGVAIKIADSLIDKLDLL